MRSSELSYVDGLGDVERVGNILSPHVAAEFPADDVARVVVQDRGQVKPAPADDLEIGKIRLPHLVWRCGFVLKLVRSLDNDVSWAGDEIVGFEQAIDRSL